MKKESKFPRVTIICDNCGWGKENQYPKNWLKKKCPECGMILITRKDLKFYRKLKIFVLINKILKKMFAYAEWEDLKVNTPTRWEPD